MDAASRKTAVVTGGTGGIGRFVALGLARAGYHVVVVGRDPAKGEAVLARIAREAPEGSAELELVDLSSLAATRDLGRRVASSHPNLSLLVLNAGIFAARREETDEGHERVLAVNHLAPFVLLRELAATLRANAPARIVTVGSSSSDRASIDPDDLELRRGWNMVSAYSRSKLGVMMTTFEWARRLEASGVTANVAHPGAVATGLVRTPGVIGLAWRGLAAFFRTEEEGAETPLHLCLAPDLAAVSGRYFKDRRVVRPNRRAEDPALLARVWAATERLVGPS
ncbi:SDR family NAD(P)-dependent oxidoreductase [Aureimonas leprariae]|nr:SDR family NAD(P)-dependent oxidoreductase [Aureimonas leprariae]